MTLVTKIFFQHNLFFPEADTLLALQNTRHSLVFSQYFTKLPTHWRPETAWARHINPDECHQDMNSLNRHLLLELCTHRSGPAKNFVYTSPWVCGLSPHQLIKCNLRMQPSSAVQRYRDRLRAGVVQPGKKLQADLIVASQYLKRTYKKQGERLFILASSNRRGNDFKQKEI